MERYDVRETKKMKEMKSRLMQEKLSRDKQLRDENTRKRAELKKEKDLCVHLCKRGIKRGQKEKCENPWR